ncbi:type II toxin-antitoxin system RelE family toxin [Oceanospirillum linum]|uniref:Addiction module toxin RelE n=1 Tax=Oceanospirillum linum TaxID=966 RepID=A0A1T1H9J9_OCELI|nr:type II toxin-antitoxin system RelE/ParE family toxin [Oceanospirillum linum]OOV86400.1 addiction module toxin RelE [Oceanospirillum linum]SEG32229.1 mRNA interferase RelE/StbE [Oleiphilus messinensis]SMP28631.1 mRNA interferase RelE/StbE [Oceanospirillum linum]
MTYKLVFKRDAEKEWRKLDATIRLQFKKKLIDRLKEPRIEAARLNGMKDCYKIKLRSAGYRLVYQVRDEEIVVSVVAVGKRERNQVYNIALKRV